MSISLSSLHSLPASYFPSAISDLPTERALSPQMESAVRKPGDSSWYCTAKTECLAISAWPVKGLTTFLPLWIIFAVSQRTISNTPLPHLSFEAVRESCSRAGTLQSPVNMGSGSGEGHDSIPGLPRGHLTVVCNQAHFNMQ